MMLNAVFTMRGFAEELGVEPAKLLLEVGPEDVENVQRFFKENHGKPVMLVSADYQHGPDLLGSFLAECCSRDQQIFMAARDLYEAFKRWCIKENGLQEFEVRSAHHFSADLRERGVEEKRLWGRAYFVGLSLNPEWQLGGDAS
jgi:hypothetical protein